MFSPWSDVRLPDGSASTGLTARIVSSVDYLLEQKLTEKIGALQQELLGNGRNSSGSKFRDQRSPNEDTNLEQVRVATANLVEDMRSCDELAPGRGESSDTARLRAIQTDLRTCLGIVARRMGGSVSPAYSEEYDDVAV